jgi:hypothetical protein
MMIGTNFNTNSNTNSHTNAAFQYVYKILYNVVDANNSTNTNEACNHIDGAVSSINHIINNNTITVDNDDSIVNVFLALCYRTNTSTNNNDGIISLILGSLLKPLSLLKNTNSNSNSNTTFFFWLLVVAQKYQTIWTKKGTNTTTKNTNTNANTKTNRLYESLL